jgi:hypothetical protein
VVEVTVVVRVHPANTNTRRRCTAAVVLSCSTTRRFSGRIHASATLQLCDPVQLTEAQTAMWPSAAHRGTDSYVTQCSSHRGTDSYVTQCSSHRGTHSYVTQCSSQRHTQLCGPVQLTQRHRQLCDPVQLTEAHTVMWPSAAHREAHTAM